MRLRSVLGRATATMAILLSPWVASGQSADSEALRRRIEVLEQRLRTIQAAREERTPETPSNGKGDAAALDERIEELSLQIKVLARHIELDKEQAAERARLAPVQAAGREGVVLRSADGNFRLRLRGHLHSDGRFFLDDGDARLADTFLLRRVRPIVESTVYGLFDFRLMPDFGDGRNSLQPPSYRGVSPRTRFDPANGTWGAVELATRYSTLVIDNEAFPAFASPATSARAARAWAAGVNWYLNSAVKLAANYQLTRFDGGAFSANRPAEHGVLTGCRLRSDTGRDARRRPPQLR